MQQQMLSACLDESRRAPSASAPPPPTPATRFQGSKLKLLPWIYSHLSSVPFRSVLDGFGGSGCVSHFLKACGKRVTFNDTLTSSYLSAVALVENATDRLTPDDVTLLLTRHAHVHYDNLIARTFAGIYFTPDENAWLDQVVQNIPLLSTRYKQALAYHALFQAALVKRPYNLFHRRNLYMRLAEVKRSFGNKTTWDTPFEKHFRAFVDEANRAVFDSGHPCQAMNLDILDVPGHYDLVYLDPPYINGAGTGVDYFGFYHFLEGMADYQGWESRIDFQSKHRRLRPKKSPWTLPTKIPGAFREVIDRFRSSTLAISYRSDGIPTPEEIVKMLRDVRKKVLVHRQPGNYQYVLSTNTRSTEILFIGTDG